MTDVDEWFTDDDEAREVFRRGDLVHRTPQPWTPAVVELLDHLEAVGYAASSRHRGYDEDGRELLTFLPGEDGPISWGYLHRDEGLASVARLLRSYHDAIRLRTFDLGFVANGRHPRPNEARLGGHA